MSNESAINVGAAGALISPWWLPSLHNVSVVAAEIAPILGGLWLILKMVEWAFEMYRKYKFRNELQARIEESNKPSGGTPRPR